MSSYREACNVIVFSDTIRLFRCLAITKHVTLLSSVTQFAYYGAHIITSIYNDPNRSIYLVSNDEIRKKNTVALFHPSIMLTEPGLHVYYVVCKQ